MRFSARLESQLNLRFLVAIAIWLSIIPQLCSAQASQQPDAGDKASRASSPDQSGGPDQPEKKRMFGIMPRYAVVEAGAKVRPLSTGQKFGLVWQNFNPYTFTFVAAEAGVNQGFNRPNEFGQGAEGYGKRYGAELADTWTGSFFVSGVYPSLLHQDPRYYRRGEGSFSRRAGYAISRVIVTRQDSGRKNLNFSEIFGNLTSGALSSAYYPDSERDASDVFQRGGVQIGFDAGFNLLKEFYPDIHRKFFGKRKNKRNN
jgi:hypothetical protein